MTPDPSSPEASGDNASAAGTAQNIVKNIAPEGQKLAGMLADQAKTQVYSEITARKNSLASSLFDTARALQSAGNQVTEPVARPMDALAERASQLASALDDKDIEQILSDTEAFARARPALFLIGAAALGLIAGRFLKSSQAAAA